ALPARYAFDCEIVAENGAQIVELARFMGHGDQPPVAVAFWHLNAENRLAFAAVAPRTEGTKVDDARPRHRDPAQRVALHGMSFCPDIARAFRKPHLAGAWVLHGRWQKRVPRLHPCSAARTSVFQVVPPGPGEVMAY